MVRPEDVPRLLAGENDRIAWKESAGERDKILRAVGALANDLGGSGRPGFVILGVDKNGRPVGVGAPDQRDQQQREIADRLRSSKIQPVPSCSISVVEHAGQDLIVLEVEPYPVPPIVEVDGIAWVRVGSTTRRANEADLQRLNERRPTRGIPFDTARHHSRRSAGRRPAICVARGAQRRW